MCCNKIDLSNSLGAFAAQSLMVSHLESDPSITESEYLSVQIVKADMERLKFIVRSYVRVRLHKVRRSPIAIAM